MQLRSGMRLGMSEYLSGNYEIGNGTMTITFKGAERTYSRLRIATLADMPLTVSTTGFTPAGADEAGEHSYTLTADDKGNAYLYGIFAEGATVSVKQGDVTLKDYTFTPEKNPNGTEPGKSYALYAGPKFSVSADKRVLFAPGNLQYTQSTDTWSFAENQYDMLGKANSENGGLADKIDLFCWSTDNGFAPFGVGISTTDSDYTGNFVDWGVNQIGDYAPNTWRTLSADEWTYLFEGRENSESLYGVAQVAGVNGMIVLPDNWVTPDGITLKTGINPDDLGGVYAKYYPEYQSFSAEQWEQMEAAGAVFLPAAGDRYGADHIAYDTINGIYWSSTVVDSTYAYYLCFSAGSLEISEYGYISAGWAVRLVKDL